MVNRHLPGCPKPYSIPTTLLHNHINDIYQNVDYKPHQDDYFSAEKFTHFRKNAKPDFGVDFQPS